VKTFLTLLLATVTALHAQTSTVPAPANTTTTPSQPDPSIQWITATSRDIPAAVKSLPDAEAIRILVAVGGAQAERALLDALPKSQGSNTVALIKALGDLRSNAVADEAARQLDSGASGDLKDNCLYALSRTAAPSATKWLRAHADTDAAVATAYLRQAEHLTALGRVRDADAIVSELLNAKFPAVRCGAVRCGAVALIPDLRGEVGRSKLLDMLEDKDRSVREQASRELSKMPREGLLGVYQYAKGEPRALIFAAIARRPDVSVAFLIPALADNDENIRNIATSALRNISGTKVDAELAKALAKPETQNAALELLAQRRARAQTAAVMALAQSSASKEAFAALGVLAGETEIKQLIALAVAATNDAARAQITKAISTAALRLEDNSRCVAALQNVPEMFRPWAMSLLPAFGGKAALDAAVAATKAGNAESREAAMRALTEWRDDSALPVLVSLCSGAENEKWRVLAARGAIRIVGASELKKEEKADWLQKIADAAPRDAEKQQALSALEQLKAKPEPGRRKKK